MTRTINRLVTRLRGPVDPGLARQRELYREWQRRLDDAGSPGERAEINAIFGRHLI